MSDNALEQALGTIHKLIVKLEKVEGKLEQLEQLEGQLALLQEKLDRSRAAPPAAPPVQPDVADPIPDEWTDRDVFRHCQIVVVRNESYDGASEHVCKYSKFVGRDGDLLRHEVVFRARLTAFRYCRPATPEEVEQFKSKTEQLRKEAEARLAASIPKPTPEEKEKAQQEVVEALLYEQQDVPDLTPHAYHKV